MACGLIALLSVQAAVQIMGSATRQSGARTAPCTAAAAAIDKGVTVQPDTCIAKAIERNGPVPETRAGLTDKTGTMQGRQPQ